MPVFLAIVAALEIVGGVLVMAGAAGVVQEIAGILGIGFGFLTAGIAGITSELVRIRKAAERPRPVEHHDEDGLDWEPQNQ